MDNVFLDILNCEVCRHISAVMFACWILEFIFADVRNILGLTMIACIIFIMVHARFEVRA